jgi:hypothetical protein
MTLITRMIVLANRHGHAIHISTGDEPWPAYPMFEVVRVFLFPNLHLLICLLMHICRTTPTRPTAMTADYGCSAPWPL